MTTYKAGDTLPAGEITDDLIGATIRWEDGGVVRTVKDWTVPALVDSEFVS